tara:strand:- start:324 stop:455 length:132 start_codon:yes stop_codon:yes gene_type:complete
LLVVVVVALLAAVVERVVTEPRAACRLAQRHIPLLSALAALVE